MNDRTIYVFVRQDIPLAEQLVAVSHASYHLGAGEFFPDGDVPTLIVIGVPDAAAMSRVSAKLATVLAGQAMQSWTDPDLDHGCTAIALGPIISALRAILIARPDGPLSQYRLWNEKNNAAVAQSVERPAEHAGEVGGSIPPCGSIVEEQNTWVLNPRPVFTPNSGQVATVASMQPEFGQKRIPAKWLWRGGFLPPEQHWFWDIAYLLVGLAIGAATAHFIR